MLQGQKARKRHARSSQFEPDSIDLFVWGVRFYPKPKTTIARSLFLNQQSSCGITQFPADEKNQMKRDNFKICQDVFY